MATQPIEPARIEWDADGVPRSPAFGDVYHARIGAQAQARAVFLDGNGLPRRWAGCCDFTIAETGLGLAHNLLATWAAWRTDPARPARLHYVSIDAHPPRREDLERAHRDQPHAELAAQLVQAWPPLVGGLHRLDFENGALRLLLAFGDVQELLPQLVFSADAFYLDGFAPDRNPRMWDPRVLKALGRRAAPGATAATWSVARSVRDGLASAGFVCERVAGPGAKRQTLRAHHAPRHRSSPVTPQSAPPGLARPPSPPRRAIVVGAGLAGASCAAALAALGWEVTVIERRAVQPDAGQARLAGIFHATVHAAENPHARLLRAGALYTSRLLAGLDAQRVPHDRSGLLRIEQVLGLTAMQERIDALGLPADFAQALDAASASARAGVAIDHPAWYYPGAGWIAPQAFIADRLAQPGIRCIAGSTVHALARTQGGSHDEWQALDGEGRVLAQAPELVLANAEQANTLLASIGARVFALSRERGQASSFDASVPLRCALAGDGYALPLPGAGLLCGATRSPDDDDPMPREADHRANFERLSRLCGLRPPVDPAAWQGHVGWRVHASDRLPLAGPLPARSIAPGTRLDQARLLPREPGLHLACAFGSRALTLAPLLAELVAARIAGTPLPLEQSLVDAVDPGRFIVRAARAASAVAGLSPPTGATRNRAA
ncbi:MAG TPA: FAD-dependent 5-carboxymethylaminomethyl-2-thiouridine(34) oxidoreductase MnmC [Rubrivivax sp.]|nr:FAD-dependent 5-carboxymethylaminomethyl-2-thiouridine(34) oxidoreductase MnmC [Rubrivivax sp.]